MLEVWLIPISFIQSAKAEIALKNGLPQCARAIKEVIFRGGELTSAFWDELLLGGSD